MYAKIQITGKLKVETGLHIGGNGAFAAIGAVDSPVIRDTTSHLPMIPGSSLKGKIRNGSLTINAILKFYLCHTINLFLSQFLAITHDHI